ncbi:hypothetical protein FB45DRAFT_337137 [Roridomyces roridus]|uniref:F-box domain-containing protein n=1 Tax=Roridomyces roridus TaxID=1738132 RepID=A0AAD7B4Y6_9AGAR|nr:hypothetical protein FB45DRAFT_337137 [Roridomyces roridus]
MSTATPRLPLELFGLVIGNLTDQSDLLRCSLVCRGWISFSRGNLILFIRNTNSATLKQLLESPENTLASTIRRLKLSDAQSFLPSLGCFTQLRSLVLWDMEATEMPDLPSLTHLEIDCIHLDSYTTFLGFMSGLIQLQDLVLIDVSCGNDVRESAPGALPVFRLRCFEMGGHTAALDRRFMSTLCTKTLRLSRNPFRVPASFDLVAQYLRDLGSNLESLQLSKFDEEHLNAASNLDFSASVNLSHLSISGAVHFHKDRREIFVSPPLLSLLSNAGRHGQLQALDLYITWGISYDTTSDTWLPPSQLQELLLKDDLASLRIIRIISTRPPLDDVSIKATLQTSLSDSRVIYDF